jgi:hypothetical protein
VLSTAASGEPPVSCDRPSLRGRTRVCVIHVHVQRSHDVRVRRACRTAIHIAGIRRVGVWARASRLWRRFSFAVAVYCRCVLDARARAHNLHVCGAI